MGSSDDGVVVLAVDILPTALPRDATNHFGDALLPILQDFLGHMQKNPAPAAAAGKVCCCVQKRQTI